MIGRARRGEVLIEVALGFVLLWTIFTGFFQFSYAILAYNLLHGAVRGGVRYAAGLAAEEAGEGSAARVRNLVVYGTPAPASGAAARLPGLAPENVRVAWSRDEAGAPRTVTVTLQGYRLNALFQNYHLSGHPSVTARHTGGGQSY